MGVAQAEERAGQKRKIDENIDVLQRTQTRRSVDGKNVQIFFKVEGGATAQSRGSL